jgi:type I restriction enzyme S subunit
MATSQDFVNWVCGPKLLPEYLYYAFRSSEVEFDRLKQGTTHKTIYMPVAEQFTVLLPPLDEQRRIAAILDKADSIRRKREEGIRLTEELLRSTFLEMFGDPVANPKKWKRVSLSSLLAIPANYGSMTEPHDSPDGWLDLRVANIQDGNLDLTSEKYIHLPSDMIERHEVRDGDLLMARAIGSLEHLGKCVVVRPGSRRWAFDSHLMRLRFDQRRAHPEFVRQFLTSPGGRHEFLKHARRSAVQFNINTKELARIQIPLPTLEAQYEFLCLAGKIEAMNARRKEALSEADMGFSCLVQRAFRGEL